jgi:coatomer subunit beta'
VLTSLRDRGRRSVAMGFDDGAAMIKVGREEPVASMDAGGKIIWARHNEIQTVNIKSLGADVEDADGERLPLAVKDLGSCDLYPQVGKTDREWEARQGVLSVCLPVCSIP